MGEIDEFEKTDRFFKVQLLFNLFRQ